MKAEFFKCNPGGNLTYIINDSTLSRADYVKINTQIMQTYPAYEQGGFIERASSNLAVVRLEMAGGEFCLNAVRCCAAIAADKYVNCERDSAFNINRLKKVGNQLYFPIETSGALDLLRIRATQAKNGFVIEAELPKIAIERQLTRRMIKLPLLGVSEVAVVELGGITHLVLEEKQELTEFNALNLKSTFKDLVKMLKLSSPAVGLIFVERRLSGIKIKPLVWVREIDTLVWETGCASGSVAAALSFNSAPSFISVVQPQGAEYTVRVVPRNNQELDVFLSSTINFVREKVGIIEGVVQLA